MFVPWFLSKPESHKIELGGGILYRLFCLRVYILHIQQMLFKESETHSKTFFSRFWVLPFTFYYIFKCFFYFIHFYQTNHSVVQISRVEKVLCSWYKWANLGFDLLMTLILGTFNKIYCTSYAALISLCMLDDVLYRNSLKVVGSTFTFFRICVFFTLQMYFIVPKKIWIYWDEVLHL